MFCIYCDIFECDPKSKYIRRVIGGDAIASPSCCGEETKAATQPRRYTLALNIPLKIFLPCFSLTFLPIPPSLFSFFLLLPSFLSLTFPYPFFYPSFPSYFPSQYGLLLYQTHGHLGSNQHTGISITLNYTGELRAHDGDQFVNR